jgi:2-hydroxy-3-keto-5-methylthiopentenyl-1-phosphate phosphatase
MLVLCDFDGTITTDDVTNVLWDRYGLPDWRAALLPAYREGRRTTLELMDEGWQAIGISEGELLSAARASIGLRDGFRRFVDLCAQSGWRFHVVSCGLDWYLRAFLPADVGFTCYTAALDGGWRVALPAGCTLQSGEDFKVHVMAELLNESPDVTVFIGDGRNDLPIARQCDHVFALRGSTLARLCREEGLKAVEFESFDTISASLTSLVRLTP